LKAQREQGGKNQSITAIVRRRIRSGNEQEFEVWSKDIARACQKYEGFLGIRVIRPDAGSDQHVTIISFDNYENYQAWQSSDERIAWLQKVENLTDGSVSTEHVSGFDYWLGEPVAAARSWPPDYKMVVAAFIAIWPLVYFVPPWLQPILPAEPISASLVSTAILTLLMGYITLPGVTRILRTWLRDSLD
jgi:uncharacterized protein